MKTATMVNTPLPSFSSPSGRRTQVARTAGLALLAIVAVCLVAGAVLAFCSLPVDPGWKPATAFAWAALWIPAGCRLSVPAMLLLACARAAAPAGEGRRGRAWRVGIVLAAFSAVRLVVGCFAIASFAKSGCENAMVFGGPAAALLPWWFPGLAHPLSEATLVLAGFCLPGLPAEDPATPEEDGAGHAERRLILMSFACLALLLMFDVLRFVHQKPVRINIWLALLATVRMAVGNMAVPIAACLALGALSRRATGRERWRLPSATPVALFLVCGACLVAGDAFQCEWNGMGSLVSELLFDLFYLAWPVWLCCLVCSRPRCTPLPPPPPKAQTPQPNSAPSRVPPIPRALKWAVALGTIIPAILVGLLVFVVVGLGNGWSSSPYSTGELIGLAIGAHILALLVLGIPAALLWHGVRGIRPVYFVLVAAPALLLLYSCPPLTLSWILLLAFLLYDRSVSEYLRDRQALHAESRHAKSAESEPHAEFAENAEFPSGGSGAQPPSV